MQEITRYLSYTCKACDDTMNAETGESLRVAWEAYVDNYGKTIDRLINAGMSEASTRPWAHRLRQASSKTDEGLQYMREARNVSQHGLIPFGQYEDGKVVLGHNGIAFSGSCRNVTISNFRENGQTIVGDTITFSAENGKMINLNGERPSVMREVPAEVRLGPISNPEKKKTVPFPATVMRHRVTQGSPKSLANAALDALKEIVSDFKREAG